MVAAAEGSPPNPHQLHPYGFRAADDANADHFAYRNRATGADSVAVGQPHHSLVVRHLKKSQHSIKQL